MTEGLHPNLMAAINDVYAEANLLGFDSEALAHVFLAAAHALLVARDGPRAAARWLTLAAHAAAVDAEARGARRH